MTNFKFHRFLSCIFLRSMTNLCLSLTNVVSPSY